MLKAVHSRDLDRIKRSLLQSKPFPTHASQSLIPLVLHESQYYLPSQTAMNNSCSNPADAQMPPHAPHLGPIPLWGVGGNSQALQCHRAPVRTWLVSAHEDLPPGSDHVPRLAADDGAGRCDRCLHLVDEGALFEG